MTLGFFGVLLILLIASRIVFSITIPDDLLRKEIKTFFKKNFNKALTFEDISVTLGGNLQITKFNLSISSDFNDNISLISAPVAVVDLSLSEVFKGSITYRNIDFKNPQITVVYKHLHDINDLINKVKDYYNNKKLPNIERDKDFSLNISNGSINYVQTFHDKKIEIKSTDLDGELVFSNKDIEYSVDCKVAYYNKKNQKNGYIDASGRFWFVKGEIFHEGKTKVDNIDISYSNDFIEEFNLLPLKFYGLSSGTIKSSYKKKIWSFDTSLEMDDCNFYWSKGKSYRILSNNNFNLDFNVIFNSDLSVVKVKSLKIKDSVLDISSYGLYQKNKKKDFLEIAIKTGKVNLTRLSEYFTPLYNISYGGTASGDLHIAFDFFKKKPKVIKSAISLKKFFLRRSGNIKEKSIIDNLDGSFVLTPLKGKMKLSVLAPDSKFDVLCNTTISKWSPFTSKSIIDIKGKKISIDIPYYLFKNIIYALYKEANKDSRRGYEFFSFYITPAGKVIPYNDFDLNWNISKLVIHKNAAFNNSKFTLTGKGGHWLLSNFNLEGYGSSNKLEFYAYFNRVYPFIELKAGVSNIDLALLTKDYGESLKMKGALSANYEIKLSAFRLGHMIQNSQSFFSLYFNNVFVKNSNLQKRIQGYLKKHKYNDIDIMNIEELNGNVYFQQTGIYFYVKNSTLKSKTIYGALNGWYSFDDNLHVNWLGGSYNTAGVYKNVPLQIEGHLLKPYGRFKGTKKDDTFLIFDIQ